MNIFKKKILRDEFKKLELAAFLEGRDIRYIVDSKFRDYLEAGIKPEKVVFYMTGFEKFLHFKELSELGIKVDLSKDVDFFSYEFVAAKLNELLECGVNANILVDNLLVNDLKTHADDLLEHGASRRKIESVLLENHEEAFLAQLHIA